MALAWTELLLLLALVGWAGRRLVLQAEALADRGGWSRGWLGLFALGVVTSLPELVTGVSAVTLADAPDLAAGDALGSCVLNLALLGAALMARPGPMARPDALAAHRVAAMATLVGLGAVTVAIVGARLGVAGRIGPVGWASVVLAVGYAWVVRGTVPRSAATPSARGPELRRALWAWALTAAVVAAAGLRLPLAGTRLAGLMGWSDSFVGTLLVALATSMPELASTAAALRVGAIDLAWGNLLGSNLFDLLVLAVDDLAYAGGPIYASVSGVHLSTLLAAALGTALALGALRPASSPTVARVTGAWLMGLFALNAYVVYLLGVRA